MEYTNVLTETEHVERQTRFIENILVNSDSRASLSPQVIYRKHRNTRELFTRVSDVITPVVFCEVRS